jgi:hypothetical protein
LPLVVNFFEKLAKKKVFSHLNLPHRYYQVQIVDGDEAETTMVMRYGIYEFLVIPFGLCNAPASFFTLMKDVSWLFLEKFDVVYLDDIVAYNKSMEEHKKHLAQ